MQRLVADVREMLTEQVEYRELLWQMTRRDILLRYKQTVMGFGWAIFTPLLNTAVFSIIFTSVAKIETPIPYPLFAYTGFWAWNFLASALRFSVSSLTSNANLVSKVYFPREVFPLSAALVCLVDFVIGSVVLIALMWWYGIVPGVHLMWLPVVVGVQLLFTVAVAMALSMANLFYRDVKYLFEVVITVWMFGTSVVYPVAQIKGPLGVVLRLNPMTAICDAYRSVIVMNSPPGPEFGLAAVIALVFACASWLVFHRAEFNFAENI